MRKLCPAVRAQRTFFYDLRILSGAAGMLFFFRYIYEKIVFLQEC